MRPQQHKRPRMRSAASALVLAMVLAAACGDDDTNNTTASANNSADAGANNGRNNANNAADTGNDDVTANNNNDSGNNNNNDASNNASNNTNINNTNTTPDLPRPDPRNADTMELGTRRGLRVARSIIHSHTTFSHDACDGMPRLEDGEVNTPCLDDYRHGVCTTRQDFVFNTDHEELAAAADYEELLLLRGDDEALMEGGRAVANKVMCEDGFRPILLPGGEFELMPVGMKDHLPGTVEERDAAYNTASAEVADALRQVGAVVLRAHTESKSLEEMRALGLDGFEIYNLHANLAPDIREDWLGLEPFGYAEGIAPFLARGGPSADLAMIGFFEENRPSLATFDTLLAEGQRLVGTAGTDSHQNVLPLAAGDGERFDSFRRMMRWFSNHLLVEALTPEDAREALRAGRAYVVFESLGSPVGFDFYAATAEGAETYEMGESVPLASAELRVLRPTVHGVEGETDARLIILRAAEGGAVEVASTEDAELVFAPTEPGAYRAEVRFVPEHLRDYLGPAADELLTGELVWIYANPIYVEAP